MGCEQSCFCQVQRERKKERGREQGPERENRVAESKCVLLLLSREQTGTVSARSTAICVIAGPVPIL